MDERFFQPYREIGELQARARQMLGVSEVAGPEEIKKAFRTLARRLHPDVAGPGGGFAGVVNAYLVLTRPDPRGFHVGEPTRTSARDPATPEDYLTWWKERFFP